MSNQHSKCNDCYKTHLPENHDRIILPSEAFGQGYVPEFNQASEDELERKLMSLFARSAEFGRVFLTSATKEEFAESIRAGALDHQEAAHEAMKLIRTEKLKTKMDLLKTIRRSYPKKQTLLGNAQSKLTLADIDRLIGETKLEAEL